MTRRPDDEAASLAAHDEDLSSVEDPNELALRELGEDDLDDDPVLPARAASAASAEEAGSRHAPAPSAASTEKTTAEASTAPRARRPRRAEPALPTAPLVHTPTAAQSSGDDGLTPAAREQIARASRSSGRRTMGVVALTALVAASVFGIRYLGMEQDPAMPPVGTQAAPEGDAPAEQGEPAPADPQKVEDLEAKLEEDPTNTGTMNSLADLHFASGDYASAQQWRERIVEIDPTDLDALMMLGVTAFNAGDVRTAEETWTKAVEVQPDNPEAYYNLGFVYMSTNRPDEARTAWEKVSELAPDSSIATTVQEHLDALEAGTGGK